MAIYTKKNRNITNIILKKGAVCLNNSVLKIYNLFFVLQITICLFSGSQRIICFTDSAKLHKPFNSTLAVRQVLFFLIHFWENFFRTWVEFQARPLQISRGIYLFEYQTKTENSFFIAQKNKKLFKNTLTKRLCLSK